jgi:hypothetical protein
MARWGEATWVGPTVNEGDGDEWVGEPEDLMYECRGLVLHIMQGTYSGSIGWGKNPESDVSFHFANAKDGRLGQLVDTAVRAWTQGAGNGRWLSIENEGYSGEALTPAQVENVAQLYARGVREYGWPLQLADSPSGYGLGWHGMGGAAWGGHPQCPGEPIKAQRPAILARAAGILGGDGRPTGGGKSVAYVVNAPGDERLWFSDGWRRKPVTSIEQASAYLAGGAAVRLSGVPLEWFGEPIGEGEPASADVAAVADAVADELRDRLAG